jgi:hypothetical protein
VLKYKNIEICVGAVYRIKINNKNIFAQVMIFVMKGTIVHVHYNNTIYDKNNACLKTNIKVKNAIM